MLSCCNITVSVFIMELWYLVMFTTCKVKHEK